MSLAQTIPDELVDLIIRDLAPPIVEVGYGHHSLFGDRALRNDLYAISLVSQRWRSCALPHLFREMNVTICPDPRTDTSGMLRGLGNRLIGKKSIYSLWQFLDHRHELCRHIERLSLKPAYMCPEDMREYALQWQDWISKSMVDSQTLASILDLLSSLRALTLTDIAVTSPTRSVPRIDKLHLERCMRTAGDVLNALSLFSVIGDLRIIFPDGDLQSAALPDDALRSVRIETLHVQGDFPWSSFTTALRSSKCLASLRELSLGPVSLQPTLWSMRHFIALFAPILVSLKCELSVHQSVFTGFFADEYLHLLEGFQWTELRDITFRFRTRTSSGRYSGVQYNHGIWVWIATLLNSLASCAALRRITLELLDFVSDTELRRASVGLRDIEHNLGKLQRVSELRIIMNPSYPPLNHAQREAIATAMPDFHNSGILRF